MLLRSGLDYTATLAVDLLSLPSRIFFSHAGRRRHGGQETGSGNSLAVPRIRNHHSKGLRGSNPPRHSSSLGSRHSSSLGSSRQRRPFRTALRHRVRRPRVYAGARPPPLLPHLLLKVVFSLFPFSSSHSLGFMFLDARVAADDGSRIIFEWRMILHLSAVNPLPLANPRYRIPR
jgi:hypothetical protein